MTWCRTERRRLPKLVHAVILWLVTVINMFVKSDCLIAGKRRRSFASLLHAIFKLNDGVDGERQRLFYGCAWSGGIFHYCLQWTIRCKFVFGEKAVCIQVRLQTTLLGAPD